MRKLASIQRIKSLESIEGADAIEKATILGWNLVVKKNEFKIGDLCVYCEIDSILPDKPEFEFLRSRKFRIKTAKLRGQISQGICFQLNILPQDFVIEEGADCTEALGITKYEPPMPAQLAAEPKGKFPAFIPKTDETRVQVLQPLLDKYNGMHCYLTEKIDGSSVTYFHNNGECGVCTRNFEILYKADNSLWKFYEENKIEDKLKALGNFALQGEIAGEGIQQNILKLRGQTVFFFNLFDIDKGGFVPYKKFSEIIAQLGLQTVPVVNDDYVLENDIEKIVGDATIKSKINPQAWAEGIVIRPLDETLDSEISKEDLINGRFSMKAINPEFLLKYGE